MTENSDPLPPADLVPVTTWQPAAWHPDQTPALVYLSSLAETGRRTQRQALHDIAAILTGNKCDALTTPWHLLNFQHTAALRAALMARYSPATANKYLSALRQVLKTAWKLGQMTSDQYTRAASIDPIKGETLPAGRDLTAGELRALVFACMADPTPAGVRDAAIVALLYTCGLRRAELVALDLADYDPDTGELIVRGKRHKDRIAFVTNGAADALADWLTVRGLDPGPLFLAINKAGSIRNYRPLLTNAVYKMLTKRGAEAGVKAFSPHDMRRSFVSDLLAAGVDLATVADLAGHANVNTTRRYDRRPKEARRQAVNKLHIPYEKRE